MITITPETTVREIAAAEAPAARVFETFGIDYCCGGRKPLAQACDERGVEVSAVLRALEQAAQQPRPDDCDWSGEPLGALCRHIEATHHVFTRDAMERIQTLASKVLARHGADRPELGEIRERIDTLQGELLPHLRREELVLFPMIASLKRRPPADHATGVRNPIRVMVADHDAAAAEMAAIRELTREYTPPEGACPTYRAFYAALAELEQDLHRHVHLENNILFPRAIALDELTGAGPSAAAPRVPLVLAPGRGPGGPSPALRLAGAAPPRCPGAGRPSEFRGLPAPALRAGKRRGPREA